MTVNYEIVEHNEGWAYRMNDVYSATFVSKEAALQAAQEVAALQEVDTVNIIDGGEEGSAKEAISDQDAELDEALEETFPASDPISPAQTTRTGGPKR